jgi:regulator of protease activity HflC (stomatin/prohibitin superfamily)
MTDELCERIRQLERSNRLWKRLAVSLMTALALLVLVAGTLGVLSVRQVTAARRAEEAQRHAAEQRLREAQPAIGEREASQAIGEQKKK